MEPIKDNKLHFSRSFQDIKDGKHVYHYEYTNIHNERIALVRLMHLWHQIGFPAAIAIFGSKKEDGKEGAEKKFIENCESIMAENPKELWEKMNLEFKPEYFPPYRRGHGILDITAWVIVISFLVLTILTSMYLTKNITSINNAQQTNPADAVRQRR